jgi:hypothetical protein
VFDGCKFTGEEMGRFRHGTAEKSSKDPTKRRGSRTTVSRHVLLEVPSLLDRIIE